MNNINQRCQCRFKSMSQSINICKRRCLPCATTASIGGFARKFILIDISIIFYLQEHSKNSCVNMDNYNRRGEGSSEDHPMYSRLFVICDRETTEDCIENAFGEFGVIESVRIPKDHNTGEHKGVAFVKFTKTSAAAKAMEALHNKTLPNGKRPLKVMVAVNRSEIQSEDHSHTSDKYRRLFLAVDKKMTEEELQEIFSSFGNVQTVEIQRDRKTYESKGMAYVMFQTFSEAAYALENCEHRYKAVFAQPKFKPKRQETPFESNINNLEATSYNVQHSIASLMNVKPEGYTRVQLMCSPFLTRYHISKIFDLVPGMINCYYNVDLMRDYGAGTITYTNPVSAAYAVQKLNNFEYPPGQRVLVRPDRGSYTLNEGYHHDRDIPQVLDNLRKAMDVATNTGTPDLAQLATAVGQASKLIKAAAYGHLGDDGPDSGDLNYCSVTLPSPQPLAHIDAPVVKRCFLVCKPQPPSLTVLRDVFCRFGDLITVYTLSNKTVGYANYASAKGAEDAIATLHGAEICGVRMKVIEAEEETGPKKRRFDKPY